MKPKRPNPLQARVLITEVAPDADQIVQQLTKDPARQSGAVRQLIKLSARLLEVRPVIQKTKQNAESRKRSIEKHLNESRRQNAQRRKLIAFDIAARLMQQDRTLRTPRKKANWQGVYGSGGQGTSLLRHIFATSVAGLPKNN
jgi:hypothetical protein